MYKKKVSNMDEEKISVSKTGTCTVGIVCKDGIVLASDKRGSAGEGLIINKNAEKLFKLTDNIAITVAGNVSDIQMILKLAKAELELKRIKTKKLPSVKEAANLFATIVYQNIRKFSPILGVSAFILGGKDNRGFSLYDVYPDGTVTEQKKFVTTGAYGSIIGLGLLDNEWKPNLTIEEAKKLALKVITTAIKRDATVGEGIDVVVIDKNGVGEIKEEKVVL
ncbi:MAG: proteasome subunit beta [Candidatus Pacearchaeota archaeon]